MIYGNDTLVHILCHAVWAEAEEKVSHDRGYKIRDPKEKRQKSTPVAENRLPGFSNRAFCTEFDDQSNGISPVTPKSEK